MITHTQLSEIQFGIELRETKTFKSFPKFKQNIVLGRANVKMLFEKYQQACRYGIDYLLQNPTMYGNNVKIIAEILEK